MIVVSFFILLSACSDQDKDHKKIILTPFEEVQQEKRRLEGSIDALRAKNMEVQKVRDEIVEKVNIFTQRAYNSIDQYLTYQSSLGNESFQRNLQSIQYNDAYINKLNEISRKIEKAKTRSAFLIDRIDTDLRVAEVVGKSTIESIRGEIRESINDNLPLSDNLDLNKLDVKPTSTLEEIWQKVRDQKSAAEVAQKVAVKEQEEREESRLVRLQIANSVQENFLSELRAEADFLSESIASKKSDIEMIISEKSRLAQIKERYESTSRELDRITQKIKEGRRLLAELESKIAQRQGDIQRADAAIKNMQEAQRATNNLKRKLRVLQKTFQNTKCKSVYRTLFVGKYSTEFYMTKDVSGAYIEVKGPARYLRLSRISDDILSHYHSSTTEPFISHPEEFWKIDAEVKEYFKGCENTF